MKIYSVSGLTCNDTGIKYKIKEKECEEKPKSYVREGVRISKDKLLKVNSIFLNLEHPIIYETYCLHEDIGNAKEIIKETIFNRISVLSKKVEVLKKIKNKEEELNDE